MADQNSIDAGDMRFRVDVQSSTSAKDAKGQPILTWTTIATRWASIVPASGQRFVASEQVRDAVTHKVVMRYFAGLTAKHRLKLGSRIFNIAAPPLDEGELHVRHTVLATEVIA